MVNDYQYFITSIKQKIGVDLSLYKETQMKRRLTSLRNKRGFKSFAAYYRALDKDHKLLDELIDRLTINVSEFYRNPKRWEVLKRNVLPFLTKKREKLSIWSAACSTGEEPYSVAMMMKKYFPRIDYHIIASDLDKKVLEKAKIGIYKKDALKNLPNTLQQKYFTKKNDLFRIDPSLQKNITFKQMDLLSAPYPQNMDLIICRNVLIYFTDQAKDIIYKKLSRSLNEQGMLFVGSTEQIFTPQEYNFKIFDTFFYKKMTE